MKKIFLPSLIIVGTLSSFVLLVYSHTESYCFFYPDIDTRFSDGFTKKAFDKVEKGMLESQVIMLLGEPLGRSHEDGKTEYHYSGDGNAFFGDWAWFDYNLIIEDGVVSSKMIDFWYD